MEANLRLKLEGDKATGEEGVSAVEALLQLTYVHLPEAYNEAVSAKQAAAEAIALAVAERKLETMKATTNLLIAEQSAVRIKDTANNEAEVLLIEVKLKAQETMYLLQKESDALVDVKNQLNLTAKGILAHSLIKLVAKANNLKVTMGKPVKLSRKDLL